MKGKLTYEFILAEVKSLQSENGENPEYGRALYELTGILFAKENEFIEDSTKRIEKEVRTKG